MGRLFGPPATIAQRIRAALISAGFRAAIAVSANFHVARIMAAFTRRIIVIPAGDEPEALATLPIYALNLPEDYAESFALWGIRSLGELAALDEIDLVTRLGHQARDWRELALGEHPHTFQPIMSEFQLKEFCEFEAPVERIESLLFMCARMIDCLVARAADRALCVALLTAQMKLDGGQAHDCTIRPVLPSIDRAFLLKLLQLEISAHPPQRGVMALTLMAEAGKSSKVQLGLFSPQTPEPSRLDVTIARLKAVVGDGRVGSPVLEDTHRANSFRMDAFTVGSKQSATSTESLRLALRRMRPPIPVRVMLCGTRPVAFRDHHISYEIEAAHGPWKTSGCWWTADGWYAEEWDVFAVDGSGATVACLLSCDRTRSTWHLEAFYD
jgi:protein ImuB